MGPATQKFRTENNQSVEVMMKYVCDHILSTYLVRVYSLQCTNQCIDAVMLHSLSRTLPTFGTTI